MKGPALVLVLAGAAIALLGGAADAQAAPHAPAAKHGLNKTKGPKTGPKTGKGQKPPPTDAPKPLVARALTTGFAPLAIERATLENGLRVVLAKDPDRTRTAVLLAVDAGARRDARGSGGELALVARAIGDAATANLDAGEAERLVAEHAGTSETVAGVEHASFRTELPTAELPLALWLAAERLKSPKLVEDGAQRATARAADAAAERAVAAPEAIAAGTLRSLTYAGFFPYEHDPLGTVTEAPPSSLAALLAIAQSTYAANAAVLVVVGDVDADHTMSLVHRFFDTATRGDKIAPFAAPVLPEQTSQRNGTVAEADAAHAGVLYGWDLGTARSEERVGARLALAVLAGDEAARLPQKLVREKGLALRVRTFENAPEGEHDLAGLALRMVPGQRRADAEKGLESELEALAKSGPTDAELARAKADLAATFAARTANAASLAEMLATTEMEGGDARIVGTELTRIDALTKEKVRAAATKLLAPSRRSVVEIGDGGAKKAVPPAPTVTPPPATPPPPPKKVKHK